MKNGAVKNVNNEDAGLKGDVVVNLTRNFFNMNDNSIKVENNNGGIVAHTVSKSKVIRPQTNTGDGSNLVGGDNLGNLANKAREQKNSQLKKKGFIKAIIGGITAIKSLLGS